MAVCELCGREEHLLAVEVESVEMSVCAECAKFGKVKARTSLVAFSQQRVSKVEEPEFTVTLDYASLLKTARESRHLNQEDFAQFLNERVSLVQKWEQGTMPPGIDTARRLEKKLGIYLIEKIEKNTIDLPLNKSSKRADTFTLGDFVKVRKRGK
ncbi:TIGR00270 family protein [Candidatus Woesearchaeota archaeon]|nr:TIGR00270 family protein [Candidatus Woesearchaeota archaeon]